MTPSKTAAERAQEALDVAERRVKALSEAKHKKEKEAALLETRLIEAMKRRDYLAQNPDLPTTNRMLDTGAKAKSPDPEF